MYVTVVGLGFQKKINIPAGSTLKELRDRMEDRRFNVFYRKGEVISNSTDLAENDSIVAMAKNQKIDLG